MKRITKTLLLSVFLTAVPAAYAVNGHYVPGVEGIRGGSVPPPGLYYRGYVVNYSGDNLIDGGGDAVPGSNTADISAFASRLIWITDKQLLGAQYGAEVIAMYTDVSLDFTALGVDDDEKGWGDIFVAPLILTWREKEWDASVELGYWFDTGDFDPTKPASTGKGFGNTMISVGGTRHLNADQTWSLSAISRYEIKAKQDKTNVTPGDSWLVEWALSHRLPSGLELGLAGYNGWQLEKNSGVAPGAPNPKIEKHAIGAEVGYFWPSFGLALNGAYYNEYGNKATTEGDLFRATLTKRF